jgi:hypothetical protein
LRINIIHFIEKEIVLQELRLICVIEKDLAITTLSTKLAGRLKEYKCIKGKNLTSINPPSKIPAGLQGLGNYRTIKYCRFMSLLESLKSTYI